MDTVFLSNGSGGVQAGNVSTGTDTQIVLTADMKPVNEVELTGYINPPQSNGNTAGPVIYDLSVSDHSRSTNADVALVVELTTGLQVYNFYASSFTHGTCVQLLGAIETDMFGANCSQSNNGILFTVNTAGTVFASSANANEFTASMPTMEEIMPDLIRLSSMALEEIAYMTSTRKAGGALSATCGTTIPFGVSPSAATTTT